MKFGSASLALLATTVPSALGGLVRHVRRDDEPLKPAGLLWVNGEPYGDGSAGQKRDLNPCDLGVTDDIYSCAEKLVKPFNNTDSLGPQAPRNLSVPTKTPRLGSSHMEKDVVLNWNYEVSILSCKLSDPVPVYIGSTLTCANNSQCKEPIPSLLLPRHSRQVVNKTY